MTITSGSFKGFMLSKFCSVKGHWLFCIQLFCIQLVKVDWYPLSWVVLYPAN